MNDSEIVSSKWLTKSNFDACVIGQDDDDDYDESGWVALSWNGHAAIACYAHCSCYGTVSAIFDGGVNDPGGDVPNLTWTGSEDELVEMAKGTRDPHIPGRQATEDDCDFDHLVKCYQQVIEWDQAGRPCVSPYRARVSVGMRYGVAVMPDELEKAIEIVNDHTDTAALIFADYIEQKKDGRSEIIRCKAQMNAVGWRDASFPQLRERLDFLTSNLPEHLLTN